MDNKKKLANRTNFIVFILAIIGFIGVVNYLSTKFFARVDLTPGNEYTVSKGTKKVLKGMDDLVTLNVYISEKSLPPLAQNMTRAIKDLLDEFQAYGSGNLRVVYRDPSDDNEIKNEARSMGLQEVPMQIVEKDKMQNVMCYMGMAIVYGDKKEILPVLNNVANLEYDLTSRIIRLTRKEVKKVGFYFGNGPHSFQPEGMMPEQQQGPKQTYNTLRTAVAEQFEVVQVTDLDKGRPVSSDIVTLVVAAPRSLSEREKFELDQFVMRGGRLIALIDAVDVQTYTGLMAMPTQHNSGDLFAHYGAKVNTDIVADGRAHSSISYQVNYGGFMLPMSTPYPVWPMAIKAGFAKGNPALSGLENLTFMWPSSVELTHKADGNSGVKSEYLISTTRFGKLLSGDFDINPKRDWGAFFNQGAMQEIGLAGLLQGNFTSFYAGKPIPAGTDSSVALQDASRSILAKSPSTSVVVLGESDFLSDGGPREAVFFMNNLIEWLSLGDQLIGIRSKSVAEPLIDPRLSDGTKSAIRIVNTVLMPLLVIAFGAFVYWRRRNRTRKGV